jgi:hypothetical protein
MRYSLVKGKEPSRTLSVETAMALGRADFSARQRHGLKCAFKPEFWLVIRLSPSFGTRIFACCTNLDGITHLSADSPSTLYSRELSLKSGAPFRFTS